MNFRRPSTSANIESANLPDEKLWPKFEMHDLSLEKDDPTEPCNLNLKLISSFSFTQRNYVPYFGAIESDPKLVEQALGAHFSRCSYWTGYYLLP